MTRLRRSDLEGVLSFLGAAQTVEGPEPFTVELLDLLEELVGCTDVTFSEIDHPNRVVHRQATSSGVTWLGLTDKHYASSRTIQLRRHKLEGGGRPMIVLSDVFGRSQRRSEFNSNYIEFGVSDEVQVDLDPRRPWFVVLSVGRDGDFGERERLMFQLLRPHLVGQYRAAEFRRRLEGFDPEARLTVREREVMLCVADGLTNAQIARVLVVEPSTVCKHLEHIYGKLGVRSRTAALAQLRAGRLPDQV